MKTKKELKAAYKNHQPVMGVFQIKNTVSGKVLVEESIDVHAKWNRHQTELRFGSYRKTKLQKDWNEYGAEQFHFSVLSELKAKEGEALDYNAELKLLLEMVLEELNISDELKY